VRRARLRDLVGTESPVDGVLPLLALLLIRLT